jgi:methionyl-tRNA formyltransferase
MSSTSKTIIFFGTEDFSLIILTALVETGYTIGAVVTKPDSKKGRGQPLTPPPVKVLATRHNIPVWQPEKLSEITLDIQALDNPIGVLASYGKIIPQSIIDLFTPGIINVHPSLLPKYRGPTPIESAIANGDDTTGVSIMQLVAKMDAGPVYAAKQYPLSGSETQISLYQELATAGADLLLETLPGIINGSLLPQPQQEDAATYCSLLSKNDAWLDPARLTAAEAERKVRAHLVFPKTKLKVQGLDIVITKAHVSNQQKTPLDIECQDGAFLSIDELIAPSGRRMTGEAYLRGYTA